MAKGSGNRIDVNLRLMQQQEVKLLQQFGNDFAKSIDALNTAMQSWSGQLNTYAANLGGGAGGGGGTQVGRSRPSGPAFDPSQTGYDGGGGDGTSYSEQLRQRKEYWAQASGGGILGRIGAEYGFAPRIAESDLMARLTSGNIGEFRSRDFMQYAAAYAGIRAGKTVDPTTGLASFQRPGYARVHNTLAALNMATNVVQSGMAVSQGASRVLGMDVAGNAPYAQIGYSMEGLMGTQFLSSAMLKRYGVGIQSRLTALMKPGFGFQQEKEFAEAMMGYGFDPYAKRFETFSEDIRDVAKQTGLSPAAFTELSQHTLRYGTKQEMEDLTKTFATFNDRAKDANMNVKDFIKSIEQMSQSLTGQYGMSTAASKRVGAQFIAATGLPAEIGASFASDKNQMLLAMERGGRKSPTQVTGQDIANQLMFMAQSSLGATSPEDLEQNWDSKYKDQFGWMRTYYPELFGGMDEQQFGKFIRTYKSRGEATGQLTSWSGKKGNFATSKEIRDVAGAVLSEKDAEKFTDWYGKKTGGILGMGKNAPTDVQAVKMINKMLAGKQPKLKVDLSPEAKKLVKVMQVAGAVSVRNMLPAQLTAIPIDPILDAFSD